MWNIDDKEFDIEFMRMHGFKRRKCSKCGAFFWSQKDDDICGESPCVRYTFINNPPTKRRYTLREMRNAFLKFFEKNGHEIINPYPVIARWRDDLLITIASIADFQPFVTSGISDPPANPLVISQPCLRFEDMDKVGLTAGRHLTIFEMGGAHAFNKAKENKFIYWKDDTVRLHHEFATDELGIPSDLITYKEHFWVGGGNAGPDLEGIISGLEVSTLVFMRYKVLPDGSLEDIPIWTVDTGYGIERWTWLSTGYPTAFEAIYNDVYHWIIGRMDIDLSREALKRTTIYFSELSNQSSDVLFNDVLRKVSNELDYDFNDLQSRFTKFVDAMKLLDFSRSALFLIKDGGIPSNVKEGYLTRMLIRRIFRISNMYELDLSFIEELFKKQFLYWTVDYRELREVEDTLYDIIFVEFNKYREILDKAPRVVGSYVRKNGKLNLDSLIEIYDSYGIPPEVIKEIYYKEYGQVIDIPQNFSELVSKKHEEKELTGVKKEGIQYPEGFLTRKLYYDNPYWKRSTAKVLFSSDKYIILDRTIFYPGEGGQQFDTGVIIDAKGIKYKVYRVESYKDAVIHFITPENTSIKPGEYVQLEIDWDRRYQLMKHHTATHILLASIRKVLGKHIWQAGAEKTPSYARLDVTHYKVPTSEDIRKIEYEVNKIISENRPVIVRIMERGEAERKYGPVLYQGGVVPGRYLRIVEVKDWDVEACGGTHVKSTGELMYFKIENVDKIHDGVIRFIYRVGNEAVKLSWKYFEAGERLKRIFNSSIEDLENKAIELMEKLEDYQSKLSSLEKELTKYKVDELITNSIIVKNIPVIVTEAKDIEELIALGEEMDKHLKKYIFIGYSKKGKGYNMIVRIGDECIEEGLSAIDIMNLIKTKILKGGGGKGNSKYARFGGIGAIVKNKMLEVVKEYVNEI